MPRKAPNQDSAEKKVKIQLGVCKRLIKEVASYEKEVTVNEARVQKLRDDGIDEYTIRKQEEVLQESYMMIPDSKSRLEKAVEDLRDILEQSQDEGAIPAELLAEAQAIVQADEDIIA
jgi:tubulin-specific chaperone A